MPRKVALESQLERHSEAAGDLTFHPADPDHHLVTILQTKQDDLGLCAWIYYAFYHVSGRSKCNEQHKRSWLRFRVSIRMVSERANLGPALDVL